MRLGCVEGEPSESTKLSLKWAQHVRGDASRARELALRVRERATYSRDAARQMAERATVTLGRVNDAFTRRVEARNTVT